MADGKSNVAAFAALATGGAGIVSHVTGAAVGAEWLIVVAKALEIVATLVGVAVGAVGAYRQMREKVRKSVAEQILPINLDTLKMEMEATAREHVDALAEEMTIAARGTTLTLEEGSRRMASIERRLDALEKGSGRIRRLPT